MESENNELSEQVQLRKLLDIAVSDLVQLGIYAEATKTQPGTWHVHVHRPHGCPGDSFFVQAREDGSFSPTQATARLIEKGWNIPSYAISAYSSWNGWTEHDGTYTAPLNPE